MLPTSLVLTCKTFLSSACVYTHHCDGIHYQAVMPVILKLTYFIVVCLCGLLPQACMPVLMVLLWRCLVVNEELALDAAWRR